MTKMYLPVNVLHTVGRTDCTNGGVTHTNAAKIVIECPDGFLTEADVISRNYSILEKRTMNIGFREHVYFAPKGETRWVMMGGNYINSSDSRFSRMYPNPMPVHDRIEE